MMKECSFRGKKFYVKEDKTQEAIKIEDCGRLPGFTVTLSRNEDELLQIVDMNNVTVIGPPIELVDFQYVDVNDVKYEISKRYFNALSMPPVESDNENGPWTECERME